MTLVERRPAPGGHWLDAYPFVRLHTPSAYYGVNSLALGENRIDAVGENAGYYERATCEEVCGHLAEAAGRLGRTGQVRVPTPAPRSSAYSSSTDPTGPARSVGAV